MLFDQWLELIDDLSEKITRLDREIERVAASHEETQLLMTVPGISSFSGLMIHAEIGEVDRFDRAYQVVSYAGLDPVVRESGVVCGRVEHLERLSASMKNNRHGPLVKHFPGGELDQAIADAQKADETRLVRRLCYVKNLYHGDTREEAGDRVGISRSTMHRWARARVRGRENR